MSRVVDQDSREAGASGIGRAPRRAPARREPRGRRANLAESLHAEWTKLRTLPGTFWLLLAIAVLTIAVSAAAEAAVPCSAADCGQDPAKVGLTGIEFGQAVVAILAVLAVSGEYSTGMIRVTFAAMPRRMTVLAAKATLISGLTLFAGAVAVLGSVLVGRLVMPGKGFTAAHGYPRLLALTDSSVLRATGGSVLYLGLIALLSLGIATLIRDSATSIGVVLALLYLSPIIAGVVSDPHWHNRIERYSPMNAGLSIQATRDLAGMPIGPWEGLGVLAAWAAGALLAGGLALRLRDA
ncbi:MAG TPA: ABC transporter permease [Actinocrinis sp.]|nr:ABC transporter permease [Actinocrinis sp.]HZU54701.1 ABC transporter permease [Actinocrinis sp.]